MFSEEETEADDTDPLPLDRVRGLVFLLLFLAVLLSDNDETCLQDEDEVGEFDDELPEEDTSSPSPSGTIMLRLP